VRRVARRRFDDSKMYFGYRCGVFRLRDRGSRSRSDRGASRRREEFERGRNGVRRWWLDGGLSSYSSSARSTTLWFGCGRYSLGDGRMDRFGGLCGGGGN